MCGRLKYDTLCVGFCFVAKLVDQYVHMRRTVEIDFHIVDTERFSILGLNCYLDLSSGVTPDGMQGIFVPTIFALNRPADRLLAYLDKRNTDLTNAAREYRKVVDVIGIGDLDQRPVTGAHHIRLVVIQIARHEIEPELHRQIRERAIGESGNRGS